MSRTEMIFSERRRDKTHLAIQNSLLSLLPHAVLEHRFSTINRIADVALLPQKIIFEIQCSPITLEEVKNRYQDYGSLGFTVIWILHDQKFNRKIASTAERYMRCHLAYFTSITPFGQGFFYDQLEFFEGVCRLYKSPPYVLEHFLPQHLLTIPSRFPHILKEKLSTCPYYLRGDLTDSLLKSPQMQWARLLEKNYLPTPIKKLLKLYRDFFLYLLHLNADRSPPSSEHRSEAKKNKEIPLNKGQNRPLL